jgi:hypothetical protein
LRGESRTKRVAVSLHREHNEITEHTRFFIHLQVADRD